MKKFFLVILILVLFVSSPAVYAADMNMHAQVASTYQKARASHGGSFSNYCGAYVGWQLYHMGINNSYISFNGNETYDYYKNLTYTTGGYKVKAYSAKEYSLKSILKALTNNGTTPVYNLVICMQRGNTASSHTYGHAAFIHAIIDGICYFSESSNLTIQGQYHPEGTPILVDIDYVCDYIYNWAGLGYTPEFEGLIVFEKSGSTNITATSTTCKYKVSIPANYKLVCYESSTTTLASARFISPKSEGYNLTCDEKVVLSNGVVRYHFVSGDNYSLYFNYDSSVMSVETKHNFYTTKTKEATCTAAGYEKDICYCGYEKTTTIPKKGHSYSSSYTTDKAATCVTDGSKSKHCTRCDAKTNVTTIPATGHKLYASTLQPHCTKNQIEFLKCFLCDEQVINVVNATGHKFSSAYTVDKKATCLDAGSKSRHCANCDEKNDIISIPALGHDWDEGKVTQSSSCSGSGVKTFSCKTCGEKKTEAISSNGHSWGNWAVAIQPTCISEGKSQRQCTKCSATETKSVEKISHQYEETATIDKKATCTQDGISSKHCSMCGSKTSISTIKATGHTWKNWTTVKQATETEKGVSERGCQNCDIIERQDIAPKGEKDHRHTFDEWVVDVQATCTTPGTKSRKCTSCNEVELLTYATTAHQLGQWEVVKDVSMGEDSSIIEPGIAERKCEHCDYSQETSFISMEDLTPNKDEPTENNRTLKVEHVVFLLILCAGLSVVATSLIIVKIRKRK